MKPFPQILKASISATRERDRSFTGSPYAVAHRAGVAHQQVVNLLNGKTKPWEIRVKTMLRLCSALSYLEPADFGEPVSPEQQQELAARRAKLKEKVRAENQRKHERRMAKQRAARKKARGRKPFTRRPRPQAVEPATEQPAP